MWRRKRKIVQRALSVPQVAPSDEFLIEFFPIFKRSQESEPWFATFFLGQIYSKNIVHFDYWKTVRVDQLFTQEIQQLKDDMCVCVARSLSLLIITFICYNF